MMHISVRTECWVTIQERGLIYVDAGTRDPDSSASSFSEHHEKRDWDAERRKGQSIKFWKKPTVRQYWHKGLRWRASEVEEVASFELFIDLLYVGIIAVIGDNAAEDPTGFGFLRFAITFILGWKMWSDLTLIISWFGRSLPIDGTHCDSMLIEVFYEQKQVLAHFYEVCW